jgi:hypothetical protein
VPSIALNDAVRFPNLPITEICRNKLEDMWMKLVKIDYGCTAYSDVQAENKKKRHTESGNFS